MAREPNIVITGFMGTGKSSVAREVAHALGRPFVDMDERIEARAGMGIPDIFRQQGEAAFRALERVVCAELAAMGGLVVATGGGALVDEENLRVMMASGHVICLGCDPDELFHRVALSIPQDAPGHESAVGERGRDARAPETDAPQGRPMLWADDPEGRLRELLEKRRPAYAKVPYHIDTTYRSVDQVVEEVLNLVAGNPTHWQVSTPTGSYPVQLVPGGVAHLGALLRAHGIAGNPVMVSDENVWALHGDALEAGLRASGYAPHAIVLPAGEAFKNLDTVRTLYDRFVDVGLDRGSAVVAVGGGVITDMAGFAAATFMRGVPLVPVPTTFLGMIDASVGGKVAVDHPAGKNLVGAFVQPLLVLLDPDLLLTLPDIERRAGLAEVIKAGIIADPELFAALEAGADSPRADDWRWQVERALQVKIDVVKEDPYEQGRRMVLNLGHTFAHAFEVLSDYSLNHGLAVSIGMAAAAHLAEIRGMCRPETVTRIVATLEAHRLPTRYDAAAPADVYAAMGSDKKRRGGRLRLILPRDIGDVVIDADVRPDEVLQALERIRTSGAIQPGAGHF